jgi:hypothetical protein
MKIINLLENEPYLALFANESILPCARHEINTVFKPNIKCSQHGYIVPRGAKVFVMIAEQKSCEGKSRTQAFQHYFTLARVMSTLETVPNGEGYRCLCA